MELVISSFNKEREILGKVSRNEKGDFLVEAQDKTIKKEIAEMIKKVVSSYPLLPLRFARRIEEKGKIRYETIVKQCRKGESDYLYALAEYLNQKEFRTRNRIAGKEIRAYIQE